ncbi:MAG: hypothetical protein K2Y29_20750 [Beijerinckiaceae bacterium]|nr:hypothetical protein [Beijerinckiaceae bacterium]
MGRVAIISNVGVRFGYPHYADLAELLARRGCQVEIIIPETPGLAEWNAGRGFTFSFVRPPRFNLPGWRNLHFLFVAGWRCRKANALLISLQPSLLIGLFYNLVLRRRVAYYLVELIVFGRPHGGVYSAFQNLLRLTSIRVLTTGRHRSRVFSRAVGLPYVPEELPLAALRHTTSCVSPGAPSLAVQARQMAGAPDGIVVALNGALSSVNCLDLLLEAEIPASSGVIIAMVGTLASPWRERVAHARARTGNYIHVGELDGNRYDLIEFLRGCDIGLVIKRYDRSQTANDRLYTPNKLFDFIAAGVPTLCSGQASMSFVRSDKLGHQLEDLDVKSLREFLLSLPQRRGELEEMAQRVSQQFQARHNLEEAAAQLVEFLA